MKRNTRKRWIGMASLALIAVAAIVVVLTVFAGTNDDRFTATAYSDVIRFQANGVASLEVRVYDLSGKEVWDSGVMSGDSADWDRRNEFGERLAYGAYLYSAQGWSALGDSIFQKNGKLALMPGDKVQLQSAPVASSPTQDAEWREEPPLSPMTQAMTTQTINDSLTVIETSGNTYLIIDTPGSGLQSILYWKENGVGRASMFFHPDGDVLNLKTYGADDIAFSLSGTERLRMTSSGRMQLTNPQGNVYLDILAPDGYQPVLYWKEGGVGRAAMFYDPGDSELNFKTYGADHITFVTAGVDRMTVRNTGNVGIGTTSPNEQLEITGNFRLPPTTATTGIIYSGGNPFIHNYSNSFFAGMNAGNLTMTGDWNTAVGCNALSSNTTGYSNTAVGDDALYNNTTGGYNTAVGGEALYNNTTGYLNTAVGGWGLHGNSTGYRNTAVGDWGLRLNTTGYLNTAVGDDALYQNTTGYWNTALGAGADVSAGDLENATAIGYGAIVNASNKVRIGDTSVTVIEGQVGWTASSDRTKKENFLPMDGPEVLNKLSDIPVNSWNYIGQDHTQFRHYGPCAQDIFAAFGEDDLGTIGTDTTITGSDLDGILMISIQTLYQMTLELEEKTNEIDNLGVQIEALLERTAELEQVVGEM